MHPTDLNTVPRVWEMLFQAYQGELNRRSADGADKAALQAEVMAELRGKLVGPRVLSAMTSSAPISPELRAWVEAFLDMHLMEGYGPTEAGPVLLDGHVQRPPVIDYKLVDVPELGYFRTDKPYPRGELLVKIGRTSFAGYYKRPEVTAEVFDPDGYYRTGDIMAELDPDRLRYVDRRNNVLKLVPGRVRRGRQGGGGARASSTAGPAGLRLRQQRTPLPAGGGRADRRGAGALAHDDDRAQGGAERIAAGRSPKTPSLQSYEVPARLPGRDRPVQRRQRAAVRSRQAAAAKLKEHYGERLEQLYAELADGQADELRALRAGRRRPAGARDGAAPRPGTAGRWRQRPRTRCALHRPRR